MEFIQRLKMELRELLAILTIEEIITNKKLIQQSEKVHRLLVKMA